MTLMNQSQLLFSLGPVQQCQKKTLFQQILLAGAYFTLDAPLS